MMLIDDRAGSAPFAARLKSAGVPVLLTRLEYGDFAFSGKGVGGSETLIGVEHKTLSDLIASIRSGRLTGNREDGTPGQLPGMRQIYQFSFLMVQGDWKAAEQGEILQRAGRRRGLDWGVVPGGMSATELDKHLLTYQLCGGIYYWPTRDIDHSTRALVSLYRWATDKALDKHTSHLMPSQPDGWVQTSQTCDAIRAWPGIGAKAAMAAESHFGTVLAAASGSVEEWAELSAGSRKFGRLSAAKVWKFLRGIS